MNEKMYMIVRNMLDDEKKVTHTLIKGDIIKLGRIKFKVNSIFIKKNEIAK